MPEITVHSNCNRHRSPDHQRIASRKEILLISFPICPVLSSWTWREESLEFFRGGGVHGAKLLAHTIKIKLIDVIHHVMVCRYSYGSRRALLPFTPRRYESLLVATSRSGALGLWEVVDLMAMLWYVGTVMVVMEHCSLLLHTATSRSDALGLWEVVDLRAMFVYR